jgi:sec-independent protein translocase protein TatB
VFGFSFGEFVVLLIVAVVVIGPRDMPKVLRRLGQWAGKLRRMASDIRAQSGIDEVLRGEGIAEDIAEIRKLARGEMENMTRAANPVALAAAAVRPDPYAPQRATADDLVVHREREYPREGADSYKALPDTALVYANTLPASPLARDPLYRTGDPEGVVPPDDPQPQADGAAANANDAEPAEEPHHDGESTHSAARSTPGA